MSGDMEFNVSPGEHAASGHPMYAFFECGTFSKPSRIRDKLDQVENHLAYHVERQRRRQGKPEIKVTDIVAVSGVASVLPWKDMVRSLGQSGVLESRHPLCWELLREGRLLCIWVDDPFFNAISLGDAVRRRTILPIFGPR